MLDYVLVSAAVLGESAGAVVDYTDLSSDHNLVTFAHVGVIPTQTEQPQAPLRWATACLRGKGDKVTETRLKLSTALGGTLGGFEGWLKANSPDTADQVCDEWVRRVEAGAKKVTRKRRAKRGFRHAWFDDEVRAAVKAKQSAFAAKELSGSESDQVEYIKLREACNELVRRKKKTSWADLLAKLSDEFKHHPRLFFSTLGQVAGVKAGADAIGPVRDADGSLQVEEDDKRDAMASFYEKLGKAVKVSSPLTEDQRTNGAAFQTRFDDDFRKEVDQKVVGLLKNTKNVRRTFGRGRERQRSKRLSNDRFKVQEIQRVLETLRLGTPGGDCLPAEFFRFGGEPMASSLCLLFNWVIDHSAVPSSWGKALVVLLFKDGDRADPGNYRGISLLDIVGKVFCRVIVNRLETNLKMSPEQGGFTRGRGCEHNLFVLMQTLHRRKRAGKDSFLFFLDVRKAFDTVWREGLLLKLWESGVQGKLWHALAALYSSNKSAILVNGRPTRWFDIQQGVRQGGTESPFLFKLYIDGLVAELKKLNLGVLLKDGSVVSEDHLLSVLLFADDIVLVAESRSDLQKLIDVVAAYSHKWRFKENLGKCGVMSVLANKPAHNKTVEVESALKLFGGDIADVSEYKYLGVWLTSDLAWERHIQHVKAKARKAVSRFQRVFSNRRLPVKLRLSVYKAYVRPHFDYASGIWWANSKQRVSLEAVQLGVLRQILQCNTKTNNHAAWAALGVVPLELRRARFMLQWQAKLLCASADCLLASLPDTKSWPAKAGRSRKADHWGIQLAKAAERLSDEGPLCTQMQEEFCRMREAKANHVAEPRRREIESEDLVFIYDVSAEDAEQPVASEGPTNDPEFLRRWSHKLKVLHLKRAHLDFKENAKTAKHLRFLSEVVRKSELLPGFAGPLNGAHLVRFRFLLGTTAVHSNLCKWDKSVNSLCPACREAEETEEHLLLHCKHYKAVRDWWIDQLKSSPWGIKHRAELCLADDVRMCATLLGFPEPSPVGQEGPFPTAISIGYVRELYETRSKLLSEETEEAEKVKKTLRKQTGRGVKRKRSSSSKELKSANKRGKTEGGGDQPNLLKFYSLRSNAASSSVSGGGPQDSPPRGAGLFGLTPSIQA